MKKFLILKWFLLSIAFTFLSASYAIAQANNIVVRVGYTPERGIITDEHAVDRIGFGYDILKKIQESSNFTFEFIPYSYDSAHTAILNDEIDIYGPVVYTREKSKEFYYIPTSIGPMHSILVSSPEKEIFYNDPATINNSSVATIKNNPFLPEFKKYLQENNINVNFVYSTFEGYSQIRADYYLSTNINEKFHRYKNSLNISSKDMYFISNPQNEKLNSQINDALQKIKKEENNFLETTYLNYYSNVWVSNKYLTREEAAKLKDKTFTVGYTIDHQPIQYNSDSGEPTGISIDVLDVLAEKYQFKVDYIGYDPKDESVDRNNFDIILSIKDNYQELYKYYNQTEPFTRLPMVIMANVPDGEIFDKNAHIKVGSYQYTTLDYSKITREFPNLTLFSYETIQEAFSGYISEKFEAGLFTDSGASYVYAFFGIDETRVIGTELTLPLRFFLSKKLPNEYIGIFNTIISNLEDTVVSDIVAKQTVEFIPTNSIISILKDNALQIVIIVLVLILGIIYYFLHEHKKKRLQIQNIINTDAMTGLISLHRFRELMRETLIKAQPNEYEIITIDIDYFRIINNIYGFEHGTKTILAISDALRRNYSTSSAIISRIVGDLFVILHKVDAEEDIETICYKSIIPSIQSIVGKNYSLSMSIGTFIIPDSSGDVNAIIDKANIARLRGKKSHSLTCYSFDKEMQKTFEKQTDIVFRMEQALKDKEFNVFFQPKIGYNNLKVEGAEALIRWFPKNASVFFPDEFIPVFEANGFIMNLDFYVFEEVLRFIKENENKMNVPVISVNLSGKTLFDENTPFRLQGLLRKYDISTDKIEVEVTESAILDNDEHMAHHVGELKKIGLTISMDDFGAGVSSLNRLSTLDIDVIKLDKSFLDYNSQARKGPIIVENIVRMALDLNMKVVTEGVEHASQARWLKEIGCHLAQGYYFEKPLSERVFLELLRSNKEYDINY